MGSSAGLYYTGCLLATQVRPHLWDKLLGSFGSTQGGSHRLSQPKTGPERCPAPDLSRLRRKLPTTFKVCKITDKGFLVCHFGIQYLVNRINTGQVLVEKVVGKVPGFHEQDQRSGKAERVRAQLATQIPQRVYQALHKFTKMTRNHKDMDSPVIAMQLMGGIG